MNYRHAFHAGNFADVFKHVMLSRILLYFAQKHAAFRVIETHAGEGIYDLASPAAAKTAEWRQGIGRLAVADMPPELAPLFAPYLAVVTPYLAERCPRYPGSPALAAALMRGGDRMIFCEAHPQAARALKARIRGDRRVKTIEIDGFVGLGAFVPPVERRGIVLLDPPYEARDEFERIVAAVETALLKWPTGCYMIWFPIKDRAVVGRFYQCMKAAIVTGAVRDVLALELWVDVGEVDGPLVANGLLLINPPYVLEGEARLILPHLASTLGTPGRAGYAILPWRSGSDNPHLSR